MKIAKIAAFSDGNSGGNPAGVVLTTLMPTQQQMQRVAADVGYSETVFAEQQDTCGHWRVRYFSPESEVPFCGHATIALGARLTQEYGEGRYQLSLNHANISVEGRVRKNQYIAALQSPPTRHRLLTEEQTREALALFGLSVNQLDQTIRPARIHGGADHYLMVLKSRADLASMTYNLAKGREFMLDHDVVTIMLVVAESETLFHVRNAFASGGVFEDPATGAAAAAFAGYLRDASLLDEGYDDQPREVTIIQGEDMGARSIISAEFGSELGSSIRVSGATRALD